MELQILADSSRRRTAELRSRRLPAGIPWSRGLAHFCFTPTTASVFIGYADHESLVEDWERVGRVEVSSRFRAFCHFLRLEKTPDGRPWLDLGVRAYGFANNCIDPPHSRIAIPVARGGKNRVSVIKGIRSAPCVELIMVNFGVLNGDTPANEYEWTEFLTPAPGTAPILLDGIVVFGRLFRTGR